MEPNLLKIFPTVIGGLWLKQFFHLLRMASTEGIENLCCLTSSSWNLSPLIVGAQSQPQLHKLFC